MFSMLHSRSLLIRAPNGADEYDTLFKFEGPGLGVVDEQIPSNHICAVSVTVRRALPFRAFDTSILEFGTSSLETSRKRPRLAKTARQRPRTAGIRRGLIFAQPVFTKGCYRLYFL